MDEHLTTNQKVGLGSNPPSCAKFMLPSELRLPSRGKLHRYDIKKLLSDPKYAKLRRSLMASSLIAIQAMEGIDISLEQAYNVYDEFQRNLKPQ